MSELRYMLQGVEKRHILSLWHEIIFFRMAVNKILELNPHLHEKMTEEIYEELRIESKDLVRKKFIDWEYDTDFFKSSNQEPSPTLQEDESKTKAEEALRELRRNQSVIDSLMEEMGCIPPIP